MHSNSIDQLWEHYYPKVYGYFYRRINNIQDIEDLTSVVMTTFVQNMLEKQDSITNPNAFLWKIAYNHLVDFIDRKSKKPIPLSYDADFEAPDERETELQARELDTKLTAVLGFAKQNFDEVEYTIFSRVYIDGDRIKDIASDLDLRANTVTTKLKRSLAKLKTYTNTL